MKTLVSTSEIVVGEDYIPIKSDFLANFTTAFSATRCQILKFETLQDYDERGNPSYDAFLKGDANSSIQLIRESKSGEIDAYKRLSDDFIEFLRVRPVVKPLSEYLKWELLNYNENLALGERIFLWNSLSTGSFYDLIARHDFMVFDSRFAMVYDYDNAGKLNGGWFIENPEKICQLVAIFGFAKANASDFRSVYPDGFSIGS